MCVSAQQVDAVPTDVAVAEKQLAALRIRHGVKEGKPLPLGAGSYKVCLRCGPNGIKWKCPEKRADEVWSIGPYDVYENTNCRGRNNLFCNRKGNSCGGERVSTVNMVGRFVEYFGTHYTLCPYCASPTTWCHRRALVPGGFACGVCAEDFVQQEESRRKNKQLSPWWEPESDQIKTSKCCYCNEPRLLKHKHWTEMQVAADNDALMSIRIVLCPTCCRARTGRWAASTSKLGVTLSELRLHISRAKKGLTNGANAGRTSKKYM